MRFINVVKTGGRNERSMSESNFIFVVNGFNAKSELSPCSGNNGAAGQATHSIHNQGWILHFHTTGSCVISLNMQIINEEKKIMF